MSDYEEHNGYFVIATAEFFEHYEWSIMAAVYHPVHQAYYLYEDSGCSCNYPYDEYSSVDGWTPDSPPMFKSELIRKLNSMRSDDLGYGFRLEDVNDMVQEIREFDPKVLN